MEPFPHLESILQLVDDESPVVQKAVEKQLLTYGEAFWQAFYAGELPVAPKSPQSRALKLHRKNIRRQALRDSWLQWRIETDETLRLESGLSLLSEYLSVDQPWYAPLTTLLNTLAEEYRQAHPSEKPDEIRLANWLFSSRNGRITGNETQYYAAQNSNPVWVLRHGRGTPLALCAIYEMTAQRLHVFNVLVQRVTGGIAAPGPALAAVVEVDQLHDVGERRHGGFEPGMVSARAAMGDHGCGALAHGRAVRHQPGAFHVEKQRRVSDESEHRASLEPGGRVNGW